MESNKSGPVNLVFVIARFKPYKGGAEENCFQLAKRASASGYNVTVLTTDASPEGENLEENEIIEGIKVVRCHRWNKQLNLGFYPSLLPRLLKIKADIVHVENGPGFLWHDFCIFAKKIVSRNTVFITTPHGPFLAVNNTTNPIKQTLLSILRVLTFPYFRFIWGLQWDGVIQVNPKQSKWLKQRYGIPRKKIELIPNGIEKDLIISAKPEQSNPIDITYVGRISWYKGIHKVIEAFQELKEEKRNIRFTVMGRTFNPEIKELAKTLSNVRFIESPSDEERDRILTEESEIHILPSQWEATGIGLLEAMAKGNALITTTGNEAAEMIIKDGETGFIYEFNQTEKLVSIIKKLVKSKKLRHEMILKNLEKSQNFTWENIFPGYKSYLERILK